MGKDTKIYNIESDVESGSIKISGAIRLWDPQEYAKIKKDLFDMVNGNKEKFRKLDMSELEYLNSSGISMICKLIFELKHINLDGIEIIGSTELVWQKKSFASFTKLWDKLTVSFV